VGVSAVDSGRSGDSGVSDGIPLVIWGAAVVGIIGVGVEGKLQAGFMRITSVRMTAMAYFFL